MARRKIKERRGKEHKTAHYIINGGKESVIYPPANLKAAYDLLFGNKNPKEILKYLETHWFNIETSNYRHKIADATTHHIIPTSRDSSLAEDYSNKIYPPRKLHEAYHTLFKNMVPDEIEEYLQKNWFNAKTSKYKNIT